MARKRNAAGGADTEPERPSGRDARTGTEQQPEQALEDTATRCLSKDERRRLSMDAWEPSLLRNMLKAQDKLRRR